MMRSVLSQVSGRPRWNSALALLNISHYAHPARANQRRREQIRCLDFSQPSMPSRLGIALSPNLPCSQRLQRGQRHISGWPWNTRLSLNGNGNAGRWRKHE